MDLAKKAILLKALRDSTEIMIRDPNSVPARFKVVKKLYSPEDGLDISWSMGPVTTYTGQELQELVDTGVIFAYQPTTSSGLFLGLKDLGFPYTITNGGRLNSQGLTPIELKEGWKVDAGGSIYNIGDKDSENALVTFASIKVQCQSILDVMKLNTDNNTYLLQLFNSIDSLVGVMENRLQSLNDLLPTVGPKYDSIVAERIQQLTTTKGEVDAIRTEAEAMLS